MGVNGYEKRAFMDMHARVLDRCYFNYYSRRGIKALVWCPTNTLQYSAQGLRGFCERH
jgi:hypothetical protein